MNLLQQIDAGRLNLVHVTMQDPPGNIGWWQWLETKWDLPQALADLSSQTEVELNVTLSHPNADSETESWDRRQRNRYGVFHDPEFPWL